MPEKYYNGAYEVIKNADSVYVESARQETFYIFRKGDSIAISRDDDLLIKTFFKLDKPFEQFLKERKRDALVKVS